MGYGEIGKKVEMEWLLHLSHKIGIKLEEELTNEELEKLKKVVK